MSGQVVVNFHIDDQFRCGWLTPEPNGGSAVPGKIILPSKVPDRFLFPSRPVNAPGYNGASFS
jgi:hypothetical protein